MEKASKAVRKRTAGAYQKAKKTAKLGSGKRFKTFTKSLEAQGYSKKSAGAIAASAGRKAHGAKTMAKLSARGRRKAKRGK